MTASTFFPGMISAPAEPAIPIVYEDSATDERSLRIHAAIQLRVAPFRHTLARSNDPGIAPARCEGARRRACWSCARRMSTGLAEANEVLTVAETPVVSRPFWLPKSNTAPHKLSFRAAPRRYVRK